MATCPSCGYSPIGPYIDNCPICAEPVRSGGGIQPGGLINPTNFPPLLWLGWIVIGLILVYFFSDDAPWLLLSLALCGAAWWAVAQGETLLLRLLGGSLLVLFIPGVWLAAQPDILPGLDRRVTSPERAMTEMLAIMKGTTPETLRTSPA